MFLPSSRRLFLKQAVPAVGMASFSPLLSPAAMAASPTFPGLITREKEPLNLEYPLSSLTSRITPNREFFVRNHFPIPELKAESYTLTLEGEVQTKRSFSYQELRKLPSKKVMALLECAGNGRANLAPKVKGLLWEKGAVGNAEWTGVPLALLLEQAGVKEGVVEIILEGYDQGEVKEDPLSPGVISFARSIPLTKAQQAEVLIAYEMNGQPLSPEHGFPVRAIIPGWYGMASVKWLKRITATSKPFDGFWQTLEYSYWQSKSGLPSLTPVTTVEIKAEIARPALSEVISAGKPYRVHGAAWSGSSEVAKVEVSTDAGKTWQLSRLLEKPIAFSWRLWEYTWSVPPTPGAYTLMVRATDAQGNTQPLTHVAERRTYMINALVAVQVWVE